MWICVGAPQMATLTTVPVRLTACRAVVSTAGMPAHSKATSGPSPPAAARIASTTSSRVPSITTEAPACSASCLRAWPPPR